MVVGGGRNFFLEIKKQILLPFFNFIFFFSRSLSERNLFLVTVKRSRQKKVPLQKQNTVIVLVNTSRSLKEKLSAPLVCYPPPSPSVLVKN